MTSIIAPTFGAVHTPSQTLEASAEPVLSDGFSAILDALQLAVRQSDAQTKADLAAVPRSPSAPVEECQPDTAENVSQEGSDTLLVPPVLIAPLVHAPVPDMILNHRLEPALPPGTQSAQVDIATGASAGQLPLMDTPVVAEVRRLDVAARLSSSGGAIDTGVPVLANVTAFSPVALSTTALAVAPAQALTQESQKVAVSTPVPIAAALPQPLLQPGIALPAQTVAQVDMSEAAPQTGQGLPLSVDAQEAHRHSPSQIHAAFAPHKADGLIAIAPPRPDTMATPMSAFEMTLRAASPAPQGEGGPERYNPRADALPNPPVAGHAKIIPAVHRQIIPVGSGVPSGPPGSDSLSLPGSDDPQAEDPTLAPTTTATTTATPPEPVRGGSFDTTITTFQPLTQDIANLAQTPVQPWHGIPIGLAELPGPGPTQKADPPSALPVNMPMLPQIVSTAAKDKVHDVIGLQLDPIELGSVSFHLDASPGGLVVTITAERPETLDLMRRHSEQFLADLRQSGFQGASLQFGQSGPPMQQHGHQQQHQPGSAPSQQNGSGMGTSAETPQAQPNPPPGQPRAGLDLRL